MTIRLAILILFFILVLIFIILNYDQRVDINLAYKTIEGFPLVSFCLISAVIGGGLTFFMVNFIKSSLWYRKTIKHQKKKIRELEISRNKDR